MVKSFFLNHLCDGEQYRIFAFGLDIFLNHLCDGEHDGRGNGTGDCFLNHLCDGERKRGLVRDGF